MTWNSPDIPQSFPPSPTTSCSASEGGEGGRVLFSRLLAKARELVCQTPALGLEPVWMYGRLNRQTSFFYPDWLAKIQHDMGVEGSKHCGSSPGSVTSPAHVAPSLARRVTGLLGHCSWGRGVSGQRNGDPISRDVLNCT